jgi:hypothetical protein
MQPVSPLFTLLDYNPRATVAADGSALITSPGTGLQAEWVTAGSVLPGVDYEAFVALGSNANAGNAVAAAYKQFNVTGTYTFEVELQLSDDMPATWTNLNDRAFIGVRSPLGYAVGFLLTKKGLLLATHPADPSPQLLQGSDKFLYDATGVPQRVVVRAILDASTKRVSVYLAASAECYDALGGASWWEYPNLTLTHNVAARATAETSGGVSIYVTAPSSASLASDNLPAIVGRDTVFVLYSLRVSALQLIPVERPTAFIDAPKQAVVGQPLTISGLGSTDKYSSALGYDWSIELAPRGSTARLQGATSAYATTVSGTATNADLVIYSRTARSTDNYYTLKITNPGQANKPLALSFADDVLAVSLATDGAGAITTTASRLYEAIQTELSAAYSAAVSAQFSVAYALLSGDGAGLIVPGVYPFTGGTGSALESPLFVPDLPGAYTFGLRVNKSGLGGAQASAKALSTVAIAATDELFNYRPSAEYVYKYLPDFWKLVRGKEQITSAWSAVMQVVSAEMVQAWQHDYSKSIRDISRKFERRWLSFASGVAVPTNSTIVVPTVASGIADVALVATAVGALPLAGYSVKEAAIAADVVYATAPLTIGKVLCRADDEVPKVVRVAKVYLANGAWRAALSAADLTVLHKLDAGTAALVTGTFGGTTIADPLHRFKLFGAFTDLIRATTSLGNTQAQITSVSADSAEATLDTAFKITDLDSARGFSWEYLRRVNTTRLTVMPYFDFGAPIDTLGLVAGDLCKVIIPNPYDVSVLTVHLPILAMDTNSVFVDWTAAVSALNAAASIAGTTDVYTAETVGGTGAFVEQFVRAWRTDQKTDLVSVPRCSTNTLGEGYVENVDHVVVDQRVEFLDFISGNIAVTAGSTHTTPGTLTFLRDFSRYTTSRTYADQGARVAHVRTGPDAGFYPFSGFTSAGALTLAWTPKYSGVASMGVPRYSSAVVPPQNHWAEVAYFDNWQTIQNNFGLMVGLPKYILDEYNPAIDYLTAVKSVCFAFMAGPSMYNLALLAEGLTGVPYVEHRGQVTRIVEPTADIPGVIVYRDEFGRDVSYSYPYGATLALNRRTNRVIKPYPLVANAKDVEPAWVATYEDSRLPAYNRLFDAVRIDDFVSNPEAVALALPGQEILKKHHTFVVDVPLDITRSTESFPLLNVYLREARPAYTNFVLYGSYRILEDVVIEEQLTMEVSAMLRDTPHTAGFSVGDTDPVVNTAGTRSLLYPNESVIAKAFADGGVSTHSDVVERYESGYQEGVLDDYSGDGSHNHAHAELDMVNQLDADLDVLACRVWVPVTVTTATDTEFIVGEELELLDAGITILDDGSLDFVWPVSPPVLLHIGSGMHPQLPFSIYTPQQAHPHTYLLLGFFRPRALLVDPLTGVMYPESTVKTNYATETRLDGLAIGASLATGALSIRGKTSQATATPVVVPDRSNPLHAPYFLLQYLDDLDKLERNNPDSVLITELTAYIPMGTATIDYFRGLSSTFDPADPVAEWATLAEKYSKQLQQYPYDPTAPANTQFVPSFGPGVYTGWAGVNPAVDKIKYGYSDIGAPVSTVPTDLTAFAVGTEAPLANVHIGIRTCAHGEWHYTHGFLGVALPGPSIEMMGTPVAGFDFRIEGNYFVAEDPTTVSAPGYSPVSFTGTIGGCYVFLRNSATQVVTPLDHGVGAIDFETGMNPAVTVLGLDGVSQTSTGHVLNCKLPVAPLAPGAYDVIVRVYRPYKLTALGAARVGYQTSILLNGVTV